MNVFQRLLDSLSNLAPDVFQAEVAAGLAYAVVLFNLHIDDAHKAAFLGAAVLVFTLAQAIARVYSGKAASQPSAPQANPAAKG